MAVDVERVKGFQFEPVVFTYDERNVSLYGLSIGAASDPLDAEDLRFVYERHSQGFQVFPTFAATFPFSLMWQILEVPGLTFNPMMLLHGEHYLEVKRPLPTQATITNQATISQVYDKGKGALVILDVQALDETGELVALNRISAFIRGIGGFGGERGPAGAVNLPPARSPDEVVVQKTEPNQALLYRLASGDGNPLHADPQMAAVGGYPQPILHGLCTFGFAARAVLKQFGGNDPARFKSIQNRFSKHVFPGDTIITEIWKIADTDIIFQTKVKERDEWVITNARMRLQDP